MPENTSKSTKVDTILSPIGNLHVIASGVMNSLGEADATLRQEAMSHVADAIKSGEKMIPQESINMYAKADSLPELRTALEDVLIKIEATLSAGQAEATAPAFKSTKAADSEDVTKSLDDTLNED
ncbi:MAG: hypothetical protein ABJN42_10535 [Roseibium sp.]|uniref:hypothetical protein n=1 Tax=Roseibium sp. TaxID=1936156 RepID=UPI00329A49D3